VTVLVPAHNEEKVIVRSIEALLASDYEPLEIVVIDDGSKDDTLAVVEHSFADEPRVRSFKKVNGGKAEALNFGIEHASGEIVIGMDADTLFAPDAISKLVRHFADERVGAVAGNAKVGNRINLLTRWQALEYITNQNLDRRAFDLLNCITVVPGAIGAWRKDLVREAGGFTGDTLAEDADLTLNVLEHGKRIDYEDEALAYTEAPDTVRGLSKQRSRWVFGTMQTFWKHRRGMFNPKTRSLGLVAMPNFLVFQILFPLVSPVMDLVMALSVASLWVQKVQHPQDYSPTAFEHIFFYYVLFLAVDFLASAVAFALEPKREQWSLLTWLFLQRFFYRQLMYVVVWRALINAIRGTIVGWHRVERKATVDGPTG
jgi:cellulose synthase/poly-beta-1,6-N-acetylglucosamine synthase-like glycosyltransferase